MYTLIFWLFVTFFVVVNTTYLVLFVLSLTQLPRYMKVMNQQDHKLSGMAPDSKPPISVLIPARDEAKTIIDCVRSALKLNYSEHEVIVIDDGSTDETLEVLTKEFDLRPHPNVARVEIETATVNHVFQSHKYDNFKVINKESGGKADALNAGINQAKYPLVGNIDADSLIDRNGLHKLVQPFLFDQDTVAAGGTIRVVNSCQVDAGEIKSIELSWNPLVSLQIIEYLRAFLFGRLGWNPVNGLLIVSGSFALFRKDIAVESGGFEVNTVTEDMEFIVRLHDLLSQSDDDSNYNVRFVPYPVCWTQVPENLRDLKNQRARWQQGLMESLGMNWKLPFRTKNPGVSWISYPFHFLFEGLGPIVEVGGYIFVLFGYFYGFVPLNALALFGLVSVGFGILISVLAFLLEELSFQTYKKPSHVGALFLFAVLENFGYRQLIAVFRLWGLFRVVLKRDRNWGDMKQQKFSRTSP